MPTAKDVLNEDINPRTVSIGTTTVIDENSMWVGDTTGLRGPIGPEGPQGPAGPSLDLVQDTDMDGVEDWIEIAVGTDATDETDIPVLGDDGVADLLQVKGDQGETGDTGIGVAGALAGANDDTG